MAAGALENDRMSSATGRRCCRRPPGDDCRLLLRVWKANSACSKTVREADTAFTHAAATGRVGPTRLRDCVRLIQTCQQNQEQRRRDERSAATPYRSRNKID